MSNMKRCSKCKERKEESEFSKKSANKNGLVSQCKACNAKYYRLKRKKEDNILTNILCEICKKPLTITQVIVQKSKTCSLKCNGVGRRRDITGQRFGCLIAIKFHSMRKRSNKKDFRADAIWLCKCDCGEKTIVKMSSLLEGSTKSCGCQHFPTGSKAVLWKGGRYKNKQGYICIYTKTHPNRNGIYVLEHHLVMSNLLGRPIDTKNESVHHKNGVRDSNGGENLELRSRYHPMGQSVVDMVEFCKDYLVKYEKEAEILKASNV